MPTDPSQLLLVLFAGVLVAELTILVRRHPRLGPWLFMAAVVATSWGQLGEAVVAGFQVYLLDVISVVLIGSIALQPRAASRVPLVLVALAVVSSFALLRGLSVFGMATAINGSREIIYMMAALAFMSIGLVPYHELERIWLAASALLVCGAVLFFARNGLGTYATDGTRALNSSQALIVAQSGIMLLGGRRGRVSTVLALICLLLVFASQQRTVWAATGVMVIVLAFSRAQSWNRQTVRRARQGLLAGVVMLAVLLTLGPTELRDSASAATSTVSIESGTSGWRVESAQQLLRDYWNRSDLDQLLGQPSGSVLSRSIAGSEWTVSPHNMYLTMLVSFGLVGLALFVLLLASATRRAARPGPVMLSLVAAMWMFSFGYQIPAASGLIIGLALAGSQSRSPGRFSSGERSTEGRPARPIGEAVDVIEDQPTLEGQRNRA